MRSEISNELLLQVLQAWDPSEADKWSVDSDGELCWEISECTRYIRLSGSKMCEHRKDWDWHDAATLVEFLLKDRPDLELCGGRCPKEIKEKSLESFDAYWDSDPWESHPPPRSVVVRIKSYEYLKEWKEKQQVNDLVRWAYTSCRTASQAELEMMQTAQKVSTPSVEGCSLFRAFGPKTVTNFTGGRTGQALEIFATNSNITIVDGPHIRLCGSGDFKMKSGEALYLTNCSGVWCETSRKTVIDSNDVTLSIEGQTIEGMEICDDILEVPATYAPICPYCNGSKEVVGWSGKEKCRAC